MSIDRGQINLPRILLLTSLVLIHISITSSSQKDADSDEFIDLGIRLTGDNTDALLADLIAEERELFNAGHVRQFFAHAPIVSLHWSTVDTRSRYVPFSPSSTSWCTKKEIR